MGRNALGSTLATTWAAYIVYSVWAFGYSELGIIGSTYRVGEP